MYLKDLLGSIAIVGYCIPAPDFYLVLHGLRCRKGTLMDKYSHQIICVVCKWFDVENHSFTNDEISAIIFPTVWGASFYGIHWIILSLICISSIECMQNLKTPVW